MRKPNTDPLMQPRRKQNTPAERSDLRRAEEKRPRQVDTLADTAPFSFPGRTKKSDRRASKSAAED
jgi:hypothetical protein